MNDKRPIIISLLGYLTIGGSLLFLAFILLFPLIANNTASFFKAQSSIFYYMLLLISFIPLWQGFAILKGMKWSWYLEIIFIIIFILECLYNLMINIGLTQLFHIKAESDMGVLESIFGILFCLFIYYSLTRKNTKSFFNISIKSV